MDYNGDVVCVCPLFCPEVSGYGAVWALKDLSIMLIVILGLTCKTDDQFRILRDKAVLKNKKKKQNNVGKTPVLVNFN